MESVVVAQKTNKTCWSVIFIESFCVPIISNVAWKTENTAWVGSLSCRKYCSFATGNLVEIVVVDCWLWYTCNHKGVHWICNIPMKWSIVLDAELHSYTEAERAEVKLCNNVMGREKENVDIDVLGRWTQIGCDVTDAQSNPEQPLWHNQSLSSLSTGDSSKKNPKKTLKFYI